MSQHFSASREAPAALKPQALNKGERSGSQGSGKATAAKSEQPQRHVMHTAVPGETAEAPSGPAERADPEFPTAFALAELVMRPFFEAQQQMLRAWRSATPPMPLTPLGMLMRAPQALPAQSPGRFGGLANLGVEWARNAPNPLSLITLNLQSQPQSDLAECKDCYDLALDLPGVDPADLEVRVGPNLIVVCGEKCEENTHERVGLAIAERHFGRFERSFALPADADTTRAEARYSDGVLHVRTPKHNGGRDGMKKLEIER